MKAIRAAVIALATVAFAMPAGAVDMMGYFRDGWGINSKGGGMTCFLTPGMDYKLRLGNECDSYGEWGIQTTIYKDKAGVEVVAGVMFDYDQPTGVGTGTGVSIGIQQNYFKMKMPQMAGATFWGGKQYYERQNIDMIDFFFLNTSDTGIGVEDVDVGFGKISFSLFGNGNGEAIFVRPDFRIYGMPINPGGTLTVDLNIDYLDKNTDAATGGTPKGTDEGNTGAWISVMHNQSGILGGSNMATLQYATGIGSGMGPASSEVGGLGASAGLNKNQWQFRALDALLLQPSNAFQVLVGGTYFIKSAKVAGIKGELTSYGIFTRPKFWVADYFNIQGDLGYTAVKPSGDAFANHDQINTIKGTIAATLSPAVGEGGGFYVRPEFRLFVTYASWNDAANNANAFNGTTNLSNGASTVIDFGDGKKAGMTAGVQVEGWF